MKQEIDEKTTLIEDNIMVALFTGATKSNFQTYKLDRIQIPYVGCEEYGDHDPILKFHNVCEAYELEYHSNWNWLMIAVEKINSLQQCVGATRDLQYTIQTLLNGGYFGDGLFPRQKLTFTKENLWIRVVEYIKHHNKKESL